MRFLRAIPAFLYVLVIFSLSTTVLGAAPDHHETKKTVVLAMCYPTVKQIENIRVLYEKDLITLDKLELLCVYHENELSDYQPSRQYVKDNKLTWVSFQTVTGLVPLKELFKRNTWTPQFADIFRRTDGIIFTGGSDIPPSIYNEENSLLTIADTPIRSMYEVSFLFHLVGGSQPSDLIPLLEQRPNYPILTICLGTQTLNVAAGGTLYQDIPEELYRKNTVEQVLALGLDHVHSAVYVQALNPTIKDLAPLFHQVRLKKDSLFVRGMKMKKNDTPLVITSHHQAIEKLGKNLVVVATSMDKKIIEAIEHEKFKNVLGVQFHPEPYYLYMKGMYFTENPGDKDYKTVTNLRMYLKKHPPAMEFHQAIWAWFSSVLSEK